ncbi:hypothetical protein FA13DRAFT_995537 [Coprinellus micaceus]|uniref:RRM domain-containing protein n=1 Tax=Coprinellus micaceus TaxID=71717 RepID=A0A4Y7SY83_COPMI|nr:hypothetical protein FA13DRAFT_995537 [Coprinellus micaceus]
MSKVVFVGNVPYNMGEDQLIDVFKSVGQVIGFRLVFDRDTGKAKGYGFCEFSDHETAQSAVRNLNNIEVGGRPLRIDLADSDPFLEGKTTVRGELMDGGYPGPAEPRSAWRTGNRAEAESFMANLPSGKPPHAGMSVLDSISATLAGMPPSQLLEVLAQFKAFIYTHPEQARTLLQKHSQLSYALFQALLLHNIIPPETIHKMQSASTPSASRMPPAPSAMPPQGYPGGPVPPGPPPRGPPGPVYQQPPAYSAGPPGMPPFAPPPGIGAPPGYPPPPGPGGYYRAGPPPMPPPISVPPPAAAPAPTGAEISDSQRDMIMQVLSLSQETINSLPPEQRATILQLRNQFMNMQPPS